MPRILRTELRNKLAAPIIDLNWKEDELQIEETIPRPVYLNGALSVQQNMRVRRRGWQVFHSPLRIYINQQGCLVKPFTNVCISRGILLTHLISPCRISTTCLSTVLSRSVSRRRCRSKKRGGRSTFSTTVKSLRS